MSEKVYCTLNVQVGGGPKISASSMMEVDAYDKIEVTIEDGATSKEVQVQPSGTGVKFLLISSDQCGKDLRYEVNDGASSTSPISLDAPVHLFVGGGAVAALGKSPVKLLFTNASGKAALVQILVGRDATP